MDCPPILLPGKGESWSRLALIDDGITFFALQPFFVAYCGRGDPLRIARDRNNIPVIRYEAHSYVPAWWLEQTFPAAAETVRAWRVLALTLRAKRTQKEIKR